MLRQLKMRQDKVINGKGKVVTREQGERDKRACSPGATPPARRGGRFGRE